MADMNITIILLLAISTPLSYCGRSNVRTETKGFTREPDNSHITKQSRLAALKRESDIISPRTKRQVMREEFDGNSTWKDGVFYTFDTTDNLIQQLFKIGVKVWRDATCIDFVEDKNARDKVEVVDEPQAFSEVGRRGGVQHLSIGNLTPTVGIAVHEIGHTLGLFHTMQRYDRDRFINIVVKNIRPNLLSEFEKLNQSYADVYGLTYDYGSIMHYDELSYSANGRPTMIARDLRYQKTMGSDLISFSDIFMINEHYGCNAKCNKSISAKCANDGYPHPRNCSMCICPSGYGGILCDRRPPGCGKDLFATNRMQKIACKVGTGTSTRIQFSFCNYMITAPEGKKIALEIQSISQGYDQSGCLKGGVEVKAQTDQKLTGYRFCSMKGSLGPIVSNSNRLPVILFNRVGIMNVVVTYRYID